MCETHQPPSPAEAAALRTIALALAVSADEPGAGGPGAAGDRAAVRGGAEPGAARVLRSATATVTLVENRSKGESATGETIVLALA
jgi:hypothetical protein